MNPSSAQKYLKKSGEASRRRAGRYSIEGELVTLADIAARLGVTEWKARDVLQREQKGAGPVTWAGLSK